jgi:hypothetical protein
MFSFVLHGAVATRSLVVLLALVSALGATVARGETLHAILVADTSPSAGFGEYTMAVAMDLAAVDAMLATNMPERQVNTVRLEFDADDTSDPAACLQAIESLTVAPNDAILFYYSGHGSADDEGPYFDLARGKLRRRAILDALAQKRPRLAVLLSDCCNTRSDGYLYAAPSMEIEPPAKPSPLFRSLFLEPAGVVDLTSAAPGESAFFRPLDFDEGLPGSIFTQELCEWVERRRGERRSWDDLVRGVSLEVHAAFRSHYPKGASVAKGARVQGVQTVHPFTYPGMPASEGSRTGIVVRDHAGQGAVITELLPGSPAAEVFHITRGTFMALTPKQVITAINGRAVADVAAMQRAVEQSPRIMRVTVRDAGHGTFDVLLRTAY